MQYLYKIRDKDRRLVRMSFSPSQRRIVEAIGPAIREHGRIRHYDLKTRQAMVSSFWAIYYLDDTIFNPNTVSCIVAMKQESLKHLWDIVRIAHANMPDELRPRLKEDSANTLYFAESNSKIMVSLKVQSTVLHNLHVSEYALCDPDEIEQTIAACPVSANITLEGVAEGWNHAHDKWIDKNDGWTRLFHPWFFQEEYRIKPAGTLERTAEEQRLTARAKRDFGVDLDDSQLQWRRETRRNMKRLFPQEYAEDDRSCFLSTGGAFFDGAKLAVLKEEAEAWAQENRVRQVKDHTTVWEERQLRHLYVIGADVANEGDGPDPDWHAAACICVTCRRTAWRYHARGGLDAYASFLNEWGRTYNKAMLAPESNGHGKAVILLLQTVHKYPNVYRRESRRVSNPNKPPSDPRFGWETTLASKTPALDALKLALEGDSEDSDEDFETEITWLDTEFLDEALQVVEKDGKIGARAGRHDDMVMAYAIAYQLYVQARATSRAMDPSRMRAGNKSESANL